MYVDGNALRSQFIFVHLTNSFFVCVFQGPFVVDLGYPLWT